MRDAHTFKTLFPYGAGDIRDQGTFPTFPPFSPAELNTTDDSNLGQIVMDAYGNIYMKVRYVQTGTAGVKGYLVCWAGPFNSITASQEPVTGTYSSGELSLTDSTTSYTANQLRGALMLVSGSTANAYGLIREIYSNTATASNTVKVKISKSLENQIKAKVDGVAVFDGNQLTSTASRVNTVPTASTKAIFVRPSYDVVLTASGSVNKKQPIGVLLGDVTAASGSTYYCTWIQIYGVGLVYFKKNDGLGNNDTLYGAAIMTGATAGCATAGSGSTALTDANFGNIAGYWLVATGASQAVLPAFICPTIRPV